MPIWSDFFSELEDTKNDSGTIDYDGVRRKYLVKLHKHTKRHVILYASAWMQKYALSVSITDEDIQAFMEVSYKLGDGKGLDLILHSPGGSPSAAEAIVSYLRSRFDDIRVIVPLKAMSAATMVACAANQIVLGKHSFLGPTDPQMLVETSLGRRMVPAQAILDQFKMAQKDCRDPSKYASWQPMLNQYGPGLLVQCKSELKLTRVLVKKWLESYMFANETNGKELAKDISSWLANHSKFKSHGRPIPRDKIKKKKLLVKNLEEDQELQELALSVFHATTHTFSGTPATKIVENQLGRAWIKTT